MKSKKIQNKKQHSFKASHFSHPQLVANIKTSRLQSKFKTQLLHFVSVFFILRKKYRAQILISFVAVVALVGTWSYLFFQSPTEVAEISTTVTKTTTADFNQANLSYVDTSSDEIKNSASTEASNWWSDSYLYRKQITIRNNSKGTMQTDTTVALSFDHLSLVTHDPSQSQADGDDIRIAYGSATQAEITRVGSANTDIDWNDTDTTIYFKLQTSIAGEASDTNYYLYYGNPSATAPTTAVNAFGFGNGADGELNVASGTTTMDTLKTRLSATANAGQKTLTVVSNGGFVAGQEIIIATLRGTAADYASVGQYEFRTVDSIGSGTIVVTENLTNIYKGTDSSFYTQVQKVPQYTNVTVAGGATLTTSDWNGTEGGLLVFRANGRVTITGTITAQGKGFRGGTGVQNAVGYQGEGNRGGGSHHREKFCVYFKIML